MNGQFWEMQTAPAETPHAPGKLRGILSEIPFLSGEGITSDPPQTRMLTVFREQFVHIPPGNACQHRQIDLVRFVAVMDHLDGDNLVAGCESRSKAGRDLRRKSVVSLDDEIPVLEM
jgi:hypothetical protein